jgi:8-oxo-dGTP pyrophosphatase MutT (NUDIX family)
MRRYEILPTISSEMKRTWQPRRIDYSAGGVAYRFTTGTLCEIALIATQGGTRWQLPKGTCEAGETQEQTAIREVEEEVGLQTENEGLLKTICYWYWDTYRKPTPELVQKHVALFLLRMVGGELSDTSIEVDAVAWFTPQQAIDILSFEGERDVVRMAQKKLMQR